MAKDWQRHLPSTPGPPIEYVPQYVTCGRCGQDLSRPNLDTKIWWCGPVDRWCCDPCQTPEDWKAYEVGDDVVPGADGGSADGLTP